MMTDEDWAVPGSFMDESLPADDHLPSSNNDASEVAVASTDDQETKATDEDFSKM